MLIGTWADAIWALRFYQNRGFRLVRPEDKDPLLVKYWNVPLRQREVSVVLADALWWCQQTHKPHTMIDLATLTGAIIISLGHHHAGVFANDDKLAERARRLPEGAHRDPYRVSLLRQAGSDRSPMRSEA